ncbi:hypothetical protein C8E05_7036 [Rhodococcus wratislaviensis]|uniref:Uncharacterized protein n=2 Tax=Rhodococcus wratislaviensis TaxID=44752 RepID=A0AB38F7B8_RHOWR|nr:hypothetical protein C8E05_7036 [Rhodococcus wratislaviensis]GAF49390.1 hypothetical protein RW1_080_00070 [Rhodococcus wratislaviensis NBRC 100605]SPZ35358.1 Uncharacterised protein [Rhodococcus wratislaviensis]
MFSFGAVRPIVGRFTAGTKPRVHCGDEAARGFSDIPRRHFLAQLSDAGEYIDELLEEGGPTPAEPGQPAAVEVATVDEVGEAVLLFGDTELGGPGIDGIHREPVAGDVGPDVGDPVSDRPVRDGAVGAGDDAVGAAVAGVEVPAGGGFVSVHTPIVCRAQEIVSASGGLGEHPVQIEGRADGAEWSQWPELARTCSRGRIPVACVGGCIPAAR